MCKFCEGKVVRGVMVLLCFNGTNVSACFGIPSVKVAKWSLFYSMNSLENLVFMLD